jgi:hypothetical protein
VQSTLSMWIRFFRRCYTAKLEACRSIGQVDRLGGQREVSRDESKLQCQVFEIVNISVSWVHRSKEAVMRSSLEQLTCLG